MFLHTKAKSKKPEHDPTYGLISQNPLCDVYLIIDVQPSAHIENSFTSLLGATELTARWMWRDTSLRPKTQAEIQWNRMFGTTERVDGSVSTASFAKWFRGSLWPAIREERDHFVNYLRQHNLQCKWGWAVTCPIVAHFLRQKPVDDDDDENWTGTGLEQGLSTTEDHVLVVASSDGPYGDHTDL